MIGLFVYAVYVARVGHFSGWAGALALAIIVIPVVVRTTDDMLKLVPNSLREAAAALGAPSWKVVTMVTYRAATRRHRDRRAARDRAHHGRNRAAALHLAQQPVLVVGHERADGQPARW